MEPDENVPEGQERAVDPKAGLYRIIHRAEKLRTRAMERFLLARRLRHAWCIKLRLLQDPEPPHGLIRPLCMENAMEPLDAGVQCPQKPRGRKKKVAEVPEGQGTGRPSAASLGFSTKGLSDAQVSKRAAGSPKERGRAEARDAKPSRRKATPSVAGSGDVAGSSTDHVQVAASAEAPKARGKRKAKTEEAEPRMDEAPDNADGKSRKRRKAKVSEPEVQQQQTGRKRNGSKPGGKGTRTKKGRKRRGAKRHVKNSASLTVTVDPVSAAKAKASRKSTAYHVAKRAALKAGKSAEEASKAAKAVPRKRFYKDPLPRHMQRPADCE